MKKVKDYEILEADDQYELQHQVMKYINDYGYELYGSPFTCYDKSRSKEYFYQAMVKYEI